MLGAIDHTKPRLYMAFGYWWCQTDEFGACAYTWREAYRLWKGDQ